MLVLAQSFSKYSKFLSAKLPMKFLYLQNSYLISYKNDSKLCIIDSFRKRELTDSLEVSLRLCLQSELPSVDCCWCRNLEKNKKVFWRKISDKIFLFSHLCIAKDMKNVNHIFFFILFLPRKWSINLLSILSQKNVFFCSLLCIGYGQAKTLLGLSWKLRIFRIRLTGVVPVWRHPYNNLALTLKSDTW